MRLRALLSALVATSLIFQPAFATEEGQAPQFHLIVPTGARSFHPGRFAPIHLEFRDSKFSEMKDTLLRCMNEGILPDFNQRKPMLYIYLPTLDMFEREHVRLTEEARRQFEELFPGSRLEIKFRVLRTNINIDYIHSRVKSVLSTFKQRFARDPLAVEYVEAIERSNDEAYQESRKALEFRATTARAIKYSIASARFYVVAGARTMQMMPALVEGGTASMMAMALIVTDASVEFFNVAFTQKIQRWLSKFPLRSNPTSMLGQVGRFVNSALWNMVLFSVGRPLAMQAIAHEADAKVPAPDLDSFTNLVGWSSIGVLFYAGFTEGYNTLRDKGWLSSSQIDMALQVSGAFDLATSLLNSNPNWYFYRLFTWGPQWTFYAVVAALARIAPVKRDRILAIETSIVDWQDVHEEQVADASWHIESEIHWDEALERIRQLEDHTDCEQDLFRLKPPGADD